MRKVLIEDDSIIVDAKSGVSGAGRGLSLANMYDECNESVKAYKIASHRHTPEIEEQLGYAAGKEITILYFTPHLIPMNRGILATCYAKLNGNFIHMTILKPYTKNITEMNIFIRLTKERCFPRNKMG